MFLEAPSKQGGVESNVRRIKEGWKRQGGEAARPIPVLGPLSRSLGNLEGPRVHIYHVGTYRSHL